VSEELVKRLRRDGLTLGYEASTEAAALIAAQAAEIERITHLAEHALLLTRGKLERADEVAQRLMAERDALREAGEGVLAFEPEHCPCREVMCNESQVAWARLRAAVAPAEQPKEGTP
jgi:hypothetical protein